MKIALTGAAGRMGRVLRHPLLKAGHTLLCSDRSALEPLGDSERWVAGDLGDPAVADAALAGTEVVIHLAGTPNEQALELVLANNHQALYQVFEAARRHRLRRVIYASSNHAFGLHPVTRKLRLNDAYRPDGFYGLSKVWGEALGRMYWEKHGIECVALRVGTCLGVAPRNRRELSTWLGTEDWIRLVTCALEAEAVAFAPVWGVSNNRRAWVDLTETNAIGFRPQQDAEDYAATALAAAATPDPIADRYQGGSFVTLDWTPDEQRPGL
jgi:uronate dehydrogenase